MQVLKAIDIQSNTYFALKVQIGSHEMVQIKSCPVRFWDKTNKVWLIPYSTDNWNTLMSKMNNLPYTISEEIVRLNYIPSRYPVKDKSVTSSKGIHKTVELNENALKARDRMKEQLIVKRYQLSTFKSYLSSVTEYFAYYKDQNPSELSLEDIRKFMLYKINKDTISESTQNCLINAIKFYYEMVEGREKFYLTDLRPRKAHKLPGFLNKKDTIKLLMASENIKHRTILQLIYSGGLRLGELTRLKVRDINFEDNLITVKCAKGKKDRITILAKTVKPLLKTYIDQYKPKYYLFEGQTGGKYSDRSVQNILHQALIKSGVDENTTVHTLRHTFATHMVLDGIDIRKVQELLGHNSIETTAIYTHITDKMKKDTISPLDNLDLSNR
ncbi:MAG: site-specific integrase [Lewinellaceae bacterium]|nr:site-specific integrase [Lewinellaceae bacterium]